MAIDPAEMRACIEAQRCPWCGRAGLRSLANHTVLVHGIYADELREIAQISRYTPLCSDELSERHRELALEHESILSVQREDVVLAAAATRERNFSAEQRRRRIEHLESVRPQAFAALRRSLEEEKANPDLAAARRVSRSTAQRAFRAGTECPICGAWFCSAVAPGQDYRNRKFCSDACRREGMRRVRMRTWLRQQRTA